MRLSELGNVLCTKNTSRPRIDSSYDTENTQKEKLVTTRLPNGQPKLAHIFTTRYLLFVQKKKKKELFALISIEIVIIVEITIFLIRRLAEFVKVA